MWPSPSCGSPPKCRGARLEVVDLDLDHDRVAGLAGAVARRDDVDARLARDRRRRCVLRVFRLLAAARGRGPATSATAATGDGREDGGSAPHRSREHYAQRRNVHNFMPKRRHRRSVGGARSAARPRRPGGASAAGLADHVHPFAGTRPGPGHLRRRPQLPRRDRPLRDGPVEPRHHPRRPQRRGGYDYRDYHLRASASPTSAAPAARSTATSPSCRRPSRSNPRRPRPAPRSTANSSPASPTPSERGPARLLLGAAQPGATAPASTPS